VGQQSYVFIKIRGEFSPIHRDSIRIERAAEISDLSGEAILQSFNPTKLGCLQQEIENMPGNLKGRSLALDTVSLKGVFRGSNSMKVPANSDQFFGDLRSTKQ
jgi:hypothetical protein